jgi:hypothetical protein
VTNQPEKISGQGSIAASRRFCRTPQEKICRLFCSGRVAKMHFVFSVSARTSPLGRIRKNGNAAHESRGMCRPAAVHAGSQASFCSIRSLFTTTSRRSWHCFCSAQREKMPLHPGRGSRRRFSLSRMTAAYLAVYAQLARDSVRLDAAPI